jgi:TetR/AcrR family transcriptional regulator, repressor of fatR-cypB operon
VAETAFRSKGHPETDPPSSKSRDFRSYSPRERILAAALKLFVEQGYFNTNVPDISRESQCSIGSIYHAFRSKEEIASALYDEGLHAFRSALSKAISQVSDDEEVLRRVVKSFLQFSEVNHHLSKYMWLCRHNEFMSGVIHHPTRVGFDSLGRKLTTTIKTGMRSGRFRKMNAYAVWSILFGVPLAYIRDWLDGYNPMLPSEVAPDLADACLRALKG